MFRDTLEIPQITADNFCQISRITGKVFDHKVTFW